MPAATLETAYCDKLTAFATRPYLKWRDIYDLWWIGTQTDAELEVSSIAGQFLHNVSAYQTIVNLSPAQALRRFLQNDPAELLRALPSALALAGLYADPDGWHPDPDDLDIPDQDHDSVLSAFELLGLDRKAAQAATAAKR